MYFSVQQYSITWWISKLRWLIKHTWLSGDDIFVTPVEFCLVGHIHYSHYPAAIECCNSCLSTFVLYHTTWLLLFSIHLILNILSLSFLNKGPYIVDRVYAKCKIASCWEFTCVFLFNILKLIQMAAIFQTTFSNAFSWMKMYEFRLKFHWSLFIHKGPINNIPALVQIMPWHRSDDTPLSEPMKVRLPTHICVTRPQCVKEYGERWKQRIRAINYDDIVVYCLELSFVSA